MKKVTILLIGPFPDPISGVSLANETVKNILNYNKKFKVNYINTSYPDFDEEVGKFSLKKLLFFLKINSKALKVFKAKIVYITPGQTFYGVLKYSLFILLAWLFRKELIIHVHGNYLREEYELLKGIKRSSFRFILSKFSKGIVLSNSLKKNLTPFLEEKEIYTLPNFAENYLYNDLKPIDIKGLKILYLSNLMKEKGIISLLMALKNLEENNIEFKAKIAGNIDQKNKEEIFELISNVKSVEYIGVVKGKEKKDLLNWSNIFVLPTYYKMEGQPISILEAMATNNVIITTKHAGIPDVINEGINGFFVDKNSHVSIEEKILFLNEKKSYIKEISENNRQDFLNNYTIEKFSDQLIRIILN